MIATAAIAKLLAEANLPFTVGFEFLADGIRVKGKPYPVVKMQWVEGQAINAFVKDNLNKASLLEAMLNIWVRLCRRLRETGMAHADLQHGNVILVPGQTQNSLGLKLVDYDGMFVPALAGKPPGEAGHASYQHPERIKTNNYSADLDRFPHLVVATALRGLLVGGKPMWEKYDTGDNLLFTAKDFTNPSQSKAMRELWDSGDPFTVGLLSHLVISAAKPLAQTPWLDTLMPEGRAPVLTPSQERQAMKLLGIPVQGAIPAAAEPATTGEDWGEAAPPRKSRPAEPSPLPAEELAFEPEGLAEIRGSRVSRNVPEAKNSKALFALIVGGLALIAVAVGVFVFAGKKNKGGETVAQNSGSSGEIKPPEEPQPKPKPAEPKPTDSKPKDPDEPMPNPPVDSQPNTPDAVEPPVPAGVKLGKMVWQINFGHDVATMVHYSKDGSKLIVPMEKTGQIRVYDAKNGRPITTFKMHEPIDLVVAAPLPGGKVVSRGSEPVMLVWDDSTGTVLSRIPMPSTADPIVKLQSDPSGRYVLAATLNKMICKDTDQDASAIFETGGGSSKEKAFGSAGAIISKDGTRLLAISPANNFIDMPIAGGGSAPSVPIPVSGPKRILDWDSRKNLAILGLPNGVICTCNTLTGKKLADNFPKTVGRAALTPDSKFVVLNGENTHNILYCDPATGAILGQIPDKVSKRAYWIDLSPDGATAAYVTNFNYVRKLTVVASPFGAVSAMPSSKPPVEATSPNMPSEPGELVNMLTLTDAEVTDNTVTCVAMSAGCRSFAYCDAKILKVMTVAEKPVLICRDEMPRGTRPRGVWFLPNDDLLVHLQEGREDASLRIIKGTTGKTEAIFKLNGLDAKARFVVNSGGTHGAIVRPNGGDEHLRSRHAAGNGQRGSS